MLRLLIVGAICLMSSAGYAVASPNSRGLECKGIKDKTKRLQCYDAIPFNEEDKAALVQQKPKKWDKEPSSFLSVALGQKIEASIAAACPTSWDSTIRREMFAQYKWENSGKPLCYAQAGTGGVIDGVKYPRSFTVWGTGVPELQRGVWVEVDDDGKVGQISAWFDSSGSASVLDALTKRFGEPTESKPTVLTLKNGSTIPGSSSTWVGEKTILTFTSIAQRLVDDGITDLGKISFGSTTYIDQRLKEQAAETLEKSRKF